MNKTVSNNKEEEIKMDSNKREANSAFEPKNDEKYMANEKGNNSRVADDYIESSEDEWRIVMPEEGTDVKSKNKKKNMANEKEKKSREFYVGSSRESDVNEKENDEVKNTRPKRTRKTVFDYNTYDYSIGQQMSTKEKNRCKQDANQKLQKIVTNSDSECDREEFGTPEDHPSTNLDKVDRKKLVNMQKSRQIVWTCPKRGYDVRPEDCRKLLSNDSTIDSVIGSWMSILEEEIKTKPNVPTCYLGSIYFRDFVRIKSTKALDKELDNMKGQRLICYPVCTPMSENPNAQPNHWTLIVLDVEEGKWTHFNTLLLGIGPDWNYHHNKELMDWVDKKMRENYDETVEQASPIVETKMAPVSNPERENYKDTPQQPKGSYDCGVCILMILEQLMLGKTKEQINDLFEFNKEEVAKYRIRMVQTFLRLSEKQKRERRQKRCRY